MKDYISLGTSGFSINSKIKNEKKFSLILSKAKFITGGNFVSAEHINNILIITENCYTSNQYPINPLLYSYQDTPLMETTYIHLRLTFSGIYYDVNTATCNGIELPTRKDYMSFDTYDEALSYIAEIKQTIAARTFFVKNEYLNSIF